MQKTLPDGSISGRICGFDLAETIAALFVVTYHISTCDFLFFRNPGIGTAITTCFRSFLVICVPLFLMINGYLLLHKPLHFKSHMLRTLRLVFLTVFWGIGPMLVQLGLEGRSLGPIAFFKEIFTFDDLWGPTIFLWYMGAMVCIYLLLPMLHIAFEKNRPIFYAFLITAAVCTLGTRLVDQAVTLADWFSYRRFAAEAETNALSVLNPLGATRGFPFVYFCLGGLLPELQKLLEKRFPNPKRRNLFLTVLMVVSAAVHTLWFLFLYKKSGHYICPVWNGYNTLSGAIISICALFLCLNWQGSPAGLQRVFRTVSENSFGIYLMHMMPVLVLRVYLPVWFPWLYSQGGQRALRRGDCGNLRAYFHPDSADTPDSLAAEALILYFGRRKRHV